MKARQRAGRTPFLDGKDRDMGMQGILLYIMIGILLLCGYIFLFQLVARRTENRNSIPLVAAVLLIIYLLIAIPLVLILRSLGSAESILIGILLLLACISLSAAVYGLVKNFRRINKGMLALFLVYLLAVAYVTIFSRSRRQMGGEMIAIQLFQFELIEEAVRTRSLEPVYHIVLNVAMFVPFGFLLPLIYPERLSKWSYVLFMGLMFTTIIEFTQMMLRLGIADLTDIVTNVIGALIGFLAFKIYSKIRRIGE